LHEHIEYIKGETLAVDLKKGHLPDAQPFSHSIDGEGLTFYVASTESQSLDNARIAETEPQSEDCEAKPVNEIVRLIQNRRKELKLSDTVQIMVGIQTSSRTIGQALYENIEYIKEATLAIDLKKGQLPDAQPFNHLIDGEELTLCIASTEQPTEPQSEDNAVPTEPQPEPQSEDGVAGLAKEVVRLIQARRVELCLSDTAQIMVGIQTASRMIGQTLYENIEYIKRETLAIDLKKGQFPDAQPFNHTIDGEELTLCVAAAESE
jgi:vacuolar-type H+-ATPase subunit I/STV1